MFFSIIVTIYNGESVITPCLDSILRDPADNFELIIINDGSTDNTGRICDEYAKRYDNLKCVHTKNQGIGNTRQTGIEKALGEYIIFVDGDDIWDKSFCLNRLEDEIKNNHADLYVFGYVLRRIGQEGFTDGLYRVEAKTFDDWRENQSEFLSYFPNGLMFPCWNKIFRRQCIVDHHVVSVNQQMEDFMFVLNYLDNIQSVSFLPIEPYIYCKREKGTSLTKQINPDMTGGYNICHQRFLSIIDPCLSKAVNQIMAPQYIATVNKCLNNKNRELSSSILKEIAHNSLATSSLREYSPSSLSERITINLMRKGQFRLLMYYRGIVLLLKRFLNLR